MISAHKIKIIKSLDKRKFRQKYNLFLVEGNKILRQLPGSGYDVSELFSTAPAPADFGEMPVTLISAGELNKISFLQHPKDSVALVSMKASTLQEEPPLQLVLDGVQDPGNLGTIIRLADWFGITQVICSEDTVDVYNPKVVQATMGSFLRVNVVYTDIVEFIKNSENVTVGTDMRGDNLYSYNFPKRLNIVLGNEGNGIREETAPVLAGHIAIPHFGQGIAESLNVAISAGIILGHYFSK